MRRIAEIFLSADPNLLGSTGLHIKHSAPAGIREERVSGLDGKTPDPQHKGRRLVKISVLEGEKTRISIPLLNTTATFANTSEGLEVTLEEQLADKSHYPEYVGWETQTGEKGKINSARRVIQDTGAIDIFADTTANIRVAITEQE